MIAELRDGRCMAYRSEKYDLLHTFSCSAHSLMSMSRNCAFLVLSTWGVAALGEQELAVHCIEPEERSNLHLLQSKGRYVLSNDAPASSKSLMKGVSYGPSLHTAPSEAHHHDYFCDAAEPVWGGRGDLKIIQSLGANTVRLYGNDPKLEHRKFLDSARSLSLDVIPGMGDKAFNSCKDSGTFSCFTGAKEAYLQNLQKGFLVGKEYHPSIRYFIVVNEPELKLPGLGEPKNFAKAIVSAIDGVLDAEDQMGIVGRKPNLTVT